MKRRRGCALLIFTRTPHPGTVKTRLIPVLGAAGAAALQGLLLTRTLALVRDRRCMPATLWYTGAPHPLLESRARRGRVGLRCQQGTDLGARMAQACGEVLRRHRAVLLVGSDCPGLRHADLEEAAAALQQGADIVLGPALDGGYYLLGLRRPRPALFRNLPWGGPRVLAVTLRRSRLLGLRVHLLHPRRDLDRPADLAHLGPLRGADCGPWAASPCGPGSRGRHR